MFTAADIADTLGRRRIADAVGVGATAVSNCVVKGTFSAAWFDVIEKLCIEAGIPCPRSAFSFVQPADHTQKPECETVTNATGAAQ